MPSVAFTFGSFGDIVVLIQLCCDLAATLRDSKRNPAEYRDLILELESFRQVLESIQRAITVKQFSSIPRSSINALDIHIQKCQKLINQFIARTQPKRSVVKGEPGTNFWDFWWNVEWSLLRKGAMVELRTGLMEQRTAINVILSFFNFAVLQHVEDQLYPPVASQDPAFGDGSQEHLMETLRESQLASVDQQREMMRYMRGLNEWQERDVHDRSAELRGVVARIDQLRDDLRGVQLNNQYTNQRPRDLCDDELEEPTSGLSQLHFPGYVPFEHQQTHL